MGISRTTAVTLRAIRRGSVLEAKYSVVYEERKGFIFWMLHAPKLSSVAADKRLKVGEAGTTSLSKIDKLALDLSTNAENETQS